MVCVSDVVVLGGVGLMFVIMYIVWCKFDLVGEVWVLLVKVVIGIVVVGKVIFVGIVIEGGVLNLYVGVICVCVMVVIGQIVVESVVVVVVVINVVGLLVKVVVVVGEVMLICCWKGEIGNDICLVMNFKGILVNEKMLVGVMVILMNLMGGVGLLDLVLLLVLVGDEFFEFICYFYLDFVSLDDFKEWMNDSLGCWFFVQQLWGYVYIGCCGMMGQLLVFGKDCNDVYMIIEGFELIKFDLIWDDVVVYMVCQVVFILVDLVCFM